MAMKSILLHVGHDASFDARMQAALDLARNFDGHVTCLHSVSFDFAVPGDMFGTVAAEMVPVIREQAQELRARLEARLQAEDVRWDWVEEMGNADANLLEFATLSDFVVVGTQRPDGLGGGPSPLAGAVAIHSRTPVLAVPPSARGFDPSAPALIAWNGSPEASRALRAATPLLAKASAVYLATVISEKQKARADLPSVDGAEYLSRHGIGCEIVELPLGDETVAETLLTAARAREAGYVVSGAYGRTRLSEIVFGGVTNGLLNEPPLPVMIAH
jgi:nucleotide-binding universal stress UspA family protein